MYSPEFLKPDGFQVDRPLREEEIANVLNLKEELSGFDESLPHYQLSVIRLNSNFVEVTDRDYPTRGIITIMALLAIFGMSWFLLVVTIDAVNRWESIDVAIRPGKIGSLCFFAFLTVAVIICSAYGLLRESFSYTHFPIRLNRKDRKIYVWRRNGTVLSAPWDNVFFSFAPTNTAG
jgi:hypothetical protein